LQRTEGTPLLFNKFKKHIAPHFDSAQQERIVKTFDDVKSLHAMPVSAFTDLFVKK